MSEPRPVHVITLADIVPGHEKIVIRTLKELAVLTRQEEGCLRYDLYIDRAHPQRLNTIECWASQADFERHAAAPHLRKYAMSLIGKVAGLPQFRVLEAIDELDPDVL